MRGNISLLSLMAFIALTACGDKNITKNETTPLVSVIKPEIADSFTQYRTYFGKVTPRQTSLLSFQVPGHIQKRYISIGQTVKKGELLFQIDDHDFQAATQAASYVYQAASAQFEAASVDYNNSKKLFDENFIAEPDLNRRHAKLLQAQSEMFRAKAKLIDSQNRLSETRLLAPYNGTITKITAEDGQNVAPGNPVAIIAREDHFDIGIDVPQGDINVIKNNSNAKIVIDYAPHKKSHCSGKVTHIGSNTDPASSTYPAVIALEECDIPVSLGMTGYVSFFDKSEKNNYFLVPMTAVDAQEQGKAFVFAVEKNRLHRYEVYIVENDDDNHYIIESNDLPKSSEIVIGPLFTLNDMQVVRVTKEMSHEKLRQSQEIGHLS